MNVLVGLVYKLVIFLIQSIKFIELQIIRLISQWLVSKAKKVCANLGIVLHCKDDPKKTEKDLQNILSNCPYDKLVHIKVKDNSFFIRFANYGTLGCGECFMDGTWDFMESEDDITQFTRRILENDLMDYYWTYNLINKFLEYLELIAFNLQTKERAFQVGKEHYDLGNDLYKSFLDPWMQYTCGYWAHASDLNQAQIDKMDLIAKKLDLRPGMKVLDIGCGWGYLCKYLTENYQVECVGVTISEEGVAYGKELCRGLPIDIRLQDYRDVNETFDRIVSVGMFEHVGLRNYREYFEIAHRCLKEDGIFLLHTIGTNHSNIPRSEKWLHSYIFPNGQLPKTFDITKFTYGLFIIEDWHNFGLDYAKTLNAWRANYKRNWHEIEHKYGDKFNRMWIYYLSMCQGLFLSRRLQLWQVVLSKNGLQSGYRAPR